MYYEWKVICPIRGFVFLSKNYSSLRDKFLILFYFIVSLFRDMYGINFILLDNVVVSRIWCNDALDVL